MAPGSGSSEANRLARPRPAETPELEPLRLIGRGGGGDVWEARQKSLGRVVAIKVSRRSYPGEVPGGSSVRSSSSSLVIEREALAGAFLEHPNILPVYDLQHGEDGEPRLVMRRVFGRSWKDILADDFRKMTPEGLLAAHLPILVDVAKAIAFAHSRGVIHRDIKPSQVMVGEYGDVLLMDWGLSVVLDPERLETRWKPEATPLPPNIDVAGNPAGTPAFMAPEQTLQTTFKLGPWTDVYLLGACLYYILTGDPPHSGKDVEAVFRDAHNGVRPDLRGRDVGRPLPEALVALVEEAMEPAVELRQLTAREFWQRLSDFQRGYADRRLSRQLTRELEEGLAAGPSSYEQFGRLGLQLEHAARLWAENPQLASIREELHRRFAERALELNDLALAQTEAAYLKDPETRASLQAKVERRRLLLRSRERQRLAAAAAVLVLAVLAALAAISAFQQRGVARQQLVEAREARQLALENQQRAEQAGAELRREFYYSGILSAGKYLDDFRPEKARETLLNLPRELRHWEWGRLMAELSQEKFTLLTGATAAGHAFFHAEFHPEAKELFTFHHTGQVMRWDGETGRKLGQFAIPGKGIWCGTFDGDGDRFLATMTDGTGQIVATETGEALASFAIDADHPVLRGGDFSPDGTLVAHGGSHQKLDIRDASTGVLLHQWDLGRVAYDVSFDPSGDIVYAGLLFDGEVRAINWRSGDVVRRFGGLDRHALSVEVDPQGTRLVVAGSAGEVVVFSLRTGEELGRAEQEGVSFRDAAFALGGQAIVASTDEGMFRIWDAADFEELATLEGAKQMEKVAVSPDGESLVTVSFDEAKVYSLPRIIARLPTREVPPGDDQEPVGSVLLTGYPDRPGSNWYARDQHWALGPGWRRVTNGDQAFHVHSLYHDVSEDGDWSLRISPPAAGVPLLKNLEQDLPARPVVEDPIIFHGQFQPGSDRFVLIHMDGMVELWDASQEARLWQLPGFGQGGEHMAWRVRFNRRGDRMAVGTYGGVLQLWDPAGPQLLWENAGAHSDDPILDLAWSHNEEMIATACSDETAAIFEASSGDLVARMVGHALNVLSVDFSPDDERLLTTSMDNAAKIWEPRTGRELLTVIEIPRPDLLIGGAFTGDGTGAFFASGDGLVYEATILPFRQEDYPLEEAGTLPRAVELWKRRQLLGPQVAADDIAW